MKKCEFCDRRGRCDIEARWLQLQREGRHAEADALESMHSRIHGTAPNLMLKGSSDIAERYSVFPGLSELLRGPLGFGGGAPFNFSGIPLLSPESLLGRFGLPPMGESDTHLLFVNPDGTVQSRERGHKWEPVATDFLTAEVMEQAKLVNSMAVALADKKKRVGELRALIQAKEKTQERQSVRLKHALMKAFRTHRDDDLEIRRDGENWQLYVDGNHQATLSGDEAALLGPKQEELDALQQAIDAANSELEVLEGDIENDPELLVVEKDDLNDMLNACVRQQAPELAAKLDRGRARIVIEADGAIKITELVEIDRTSDEIPDLFRDLLPVLAKHDKRLAASLPEALRQTLGLLHLTILT